MLRHTFTIIGKCPVCGHSIFDGDEARESEDPGADYLHKSCLKRKQQQMQAQVSTSVKT